MLKKQNIIYYNYLKKDTCILNDIIYIKNFYSNDCIYKFITPVKFNLYFECNPYNYIKINLILKTKILIKCSQCVSLFNKIFLSDIEIEYKISKNISCLDYNKLNFYRLIKEEIFLSVPLLHKHL